ncbi:MAG TPA: hypothetical protein V6C65_00085, partial [Allocoleopsis sp.]
DVVGRLVRQVLEKRRPKTRYALVPNAFRDWYMLRILPDRVLDRIIRRNLNLFTKANTNL